MHPPDQNPNQFPNPYQQPQWNAYQPFHPPKPRYSWRGRLTVLAITGLLYLIACATPALEFDDTQQSIFYGFHILIIGWLAALIAQFAWFANLILLVSIFLLLFRQWIATFIGSLLAFILALQTFMLFSQKIPADGAATRHLLLQNMKIGFYFWLASMLCIGIGALILRHGERPVQE
jgi:hypothetical protein